MCCCVYVLLFTKYVRSHFFEISVSQQEFDMEKERLLQARNLRDQATQVNMQIHLRTP